MINLIFNRVESDEYKNLFLVLDKINTDGFNTGLHYINFTPDCDVDAVINAVNTQERKTLVDIPQDAIAAIKAEATSWTPEVIAAYQAAQAAATPA
jgi:hypothetical protein